VLGDRGECLFAIATFTHDLNGVVVLEKTANGFAGGRLIVGD